MANGQLPDDVTFSPPAASAPADMSDVTFTPPSTQQTPPTRTPATGLEGVLSGIGGGVMETAEGAKNLINKGINLALPPSEGIKIPDIPKEYRENVTPSEKVGGGLETVGEFMAGDAALEGLSKAAKMVELADKYPIVARTLELAKEHPVLSKIISGTAKSAAVGAGQGAVKGAAEGKAKEEAEGGAIGGAVGGAVGETASEVAGALAKRLGVGTTAVEDAARGAKPAKRNYRFADDFKKAAPRIDAEATASGGAKTLEDWADATGDARKKLWATEVQPLVDKHATVPLSGIAIKNGIESAIPDAMKKFAPEKAAEVTRFANEFMPGVTNAQFQLTVGEAEAALEHFNAELANTGYWSKMPAERAAMEKTNPDIIKFKGAADAIRDELYNRLQTVEPTANLADLKQTYGALRNVENEIRGQVNVQGRQSPISLKEAIGLMTGLGAGGLGGTAAALVGPLDRAMNAPEKLLGRAVRKAARPAEKSAVETGVNAARNLIEKAPAVTGAAVGENVGEQMAPERVMFRDSSGALHSVPADQLDAARQVDPQLQVVTQ